MKAKTIKLKHLCYQNQKTSVLELKVLQKQTSNM